MPKFTDCILTKWSRNGISLFNHLFSTICLCISRFHILQCFIGARHNMKENESNILLIYSLYENGRLITYLFKYFMYTYYNTYLVGFELEVRFV